MDTSKTKRAKPGNKHEKSLVVGEKDELMKFLIANFPGKNRNNIKTLLKDRQILVNGEVVSQFNHPLRPGDQVMQRPEKIPEAKQYRGYSIVYEDPHIVVIDKHAGVLSMSTDGKRDITAYSMLSDHVKRQNPANKIFIVHRLDRDTSGIMMFVKRKDLQKKLQSNWNRSVQERSYLALVEGELENKEGNVVSYIKENSALNVFSSNDPEQGLRAVTHYRVIKTNKQFSLLKIELGTGRKNQIRVHLNELGHPIVGDKKYGSTINPIGRLGLHAQVLAFDHPETGELMRFESPVPKKFKFII
jgi:23S rRNA pseudouridine1911/1915/1917 synthase